MLCEGRGPIPATTIAMRSIPRLAILLGLAVLPVSLGGCSATSQRSAATAEQPRIEMNQGHSSDLVLPGRTLASLSGPGNWEFGRNDARLGRRGLDPIAGSFAAPAPDLRFSRRITLPRQADQFLIPHHSAAPFIYEGRRDRSRGFGDRRRRGW